MTQENTQESRFYVIDLHWLITTSDPLSKPSWNMSYAFLFQCLNSYKSNCKV